jgi:hypothetical protein
MIVHRGVYVYFLSQTRTYFVAQNIEADLKGKYSPFLDCI